MLHVKSCCKKYSINAGTIAAAHASQILCLGHYFIIVGIQTVNKGMRVKDMTWKNVVVTVYGMHMVCI